MSIYVATFLMLENKCPEHAKRLLTSLRDGSSTEEERSLALELQYPLPQTSPVLELGPFPCSSSTKLIKYLLLSSTAYNFLCHAFYLLMSI